MLAQIAGCGLRLALWVLLHTPALAASSFGFSTTGGEAWTFHKRIEVLAPEGTCDLIVIGGANGLIEGKPANGRLVALFPLSPGHNDIAAECRRSGLRVGEPIRQAWLARLRNAPTARIKAHVSGSKLELDAGGSQPAAAEPAPIIAYEWRAGSDNPMSIALPGEGMHLTMPSPRLNGEYRVTLRVRDAAGRADESTIIFRVRQGRPEPIDTTREPPTWLDGAVIYGVAPRLFGPRGLADVSARLDTLARLGVNTLWLAPVTASAASDFGYAVTDHFVVRSDFGSAAELRQLIAGAHARRMRVILDFVPNHLSDQHPYVQDVARRGRSSPYFDFFARSSSGGISSYFNWENLKNLNYDNEDVRRFMLEAFSHWVRAFDVDGFRVDAAWGPRERAPDVWLHINRELKRIKPDLLLLAEASAKDPYYVHNGFDAAYDWTEKLGAWAWEAAFQRQHSIALALREALTVEATARNRLVFRFINNNDTGVRFITRHGVSLTRVAAAMLLTLPGLPGLYTGDEVGAAFEPYKDAGPINWADPYALSPWYAQLLSLRRSLPALRSRAFEILDLEPADKVLGYLRLDESGQGDPVLVLLNYGAEPVRVKLPSEALARLGNAPGLIDLCRGTTWSGSGRGAIDLDGYGVSILQARWLSPT
jgi:cyclomaltodextrinase / maltogenic alpha-amylase / neopullulanase